MAEKDEKKAEEKNKVEEKEEKQAPKDNLVVTQHKVRIGGKEIKYTVTAGTIVLKEETPIVRRKRRERSRARKSSLLHIPRIAMARNPLEKSSSSSKTSAYVFVQWRAGFIIRMAAFGSTGAAPRGVDR